jgi:hypothetical protein
MSEEKKCPKCKSGVKFRGSAVVEYFCYSHNRPDGSGFAQSHVCKNRLITELESKLAKAITALERVLDADASYLKHEMDRALRLASTTLAELKGNTK